MKITFGTLWLAVLALSSVTVASAERRQIFSDTFQNELAKEWKFVGGKWAVREGRLEQTDPGPADPKKAILVIGNEDDASIDVVITAKLRFDRLTRDQKSRAGISVCSDPKTGHGLNLAFVDDKLQFFHDSVAWGESCDFACESGKWYWMKLWKSAGEMKGKAWKDGENEPGDWMVTWNGYDTQLTGYPGLNGGAYDGASVSFAQMKVEIDPAPIKLQILPGQPDRMPLLLDQFGPPSRNPRAVIILAAKTLPKGDFVLAGFRGGQEVSRQSLNWQWTKPWTARVDLEAGQEEVALLFKSAPGEQEKEIQRQKVPRPNGAPDPRPWALKGPGARIPIVTTTEILLSGPDWKLGSFAPGQGELAQAYQPGFDDRDFRTVSVPGEVQLQVGLQGMELYYQSRELSFLNQKEWWYRKSFVPASDDQGKVVRLLFEGVDYFATVWLNGEKLGEHEGCFVPFTSFDVSGKLRSGAENVLAVKVTCPWIPKDRGFHEYMKGEWTMEPGSSLRLRSPALVMGPYWDGIPAYGNAAFPMGLFRDVKLVASGAVTLNDLFVRTQSLNEDGSATLAVSGKAVNYGDQAVAVKLEWNIGPENFAGEEMPLPGQALNLKPGENPFSAQVEVKHPQLWWTWDTGAQNLYKLTASISAAAGQGVDSRQAVFGIRTIERHPDMSYWLNRQRLYLKGGWFPMSDYFLSRTTRADYEKDLELYKAANLNHLIAFSVVEKPDFYDLCDRLGILDMFEFPFQQYGPAEVLNPANPRREIFAEESLSQLRHIVLQLRNHPSIIVWTPFAEIGDANKKYGEYASQIEKLVEELDPGTIFHGSFCDVGETHFWMAVAGWGWEGSYQEHFDSNIGFVSEYGSEAIPAYETLKKMMTPEEMWSDRNTLETNVLNVPIDLPVYAYHTCFEYMGINSILHRINQFVDRQPRTLPELIDDSQLYQAFLFKYVTECYRRKKYNSINGTRFWCYRDLAPKIGWGVVDGYHVPKMSYYYLKTAQERFSLNFAFKDALEPQASGKSLKIPVWVINDYRREMPVKVQCEIYDLKGQKHWSQELAGTVASDGGKEIGVLNWVASADPGIYVLRGEAGEQGGEGLVARNSAFIHVVAPAHTNASNKVIMPTQELASPLRVLLIAQKQFGEPIAKWLAGAGVKVEVINEDKNEQFAVLRDPETLCEQYDAVWLGSFDSLWKLMDDEMAKGLAGAIERGVGFIHTGGEGSFHGGAGRGALIDARALAEVLPVKLRNRNDVVYDWGANVKDITLVGSQAEGWNESGLKESGVAGFNEVELKADSEQIMTVSGRPLLVAGKYGRGKTVAFTGFTPKEKTMPPGYAELFMRMLVEVGGDNIRAVYDELAAPGKPLFESLKDLPEASVSLPESLEVIVTGTRAKSALKITNGGVFARLVRWRVEWNQPDAESPFIMFSDNFIDLLPQESKSIDLDMLLPQQRPVKATGSLVVEGPNVKTRRIPIQVDAN
jgi:beta-mannosidase